MQLKPIKYILLLISILLVALCPFGLSGYFLLFSPDSLGQLLALGFAFTAGPFLSILGGIGIFVLWKYKKYTMLTALMFTFFILDFSSIPFLWNAHRNFQNKLIRDSNNNLPADSVHQFIAWTQQDELDKAKELWYGRSKLISKLDDGTIHDGTIPFEEFCKNFRNINLNECKITKANKGKSGFFMIYIYWHENGQKKQYSFGLKLVEGIWKMERGYSW